MNSPPLVTELSYSEFGDWYDGLRTEVLEPALAVAEASLDRALTGLLTDRDLTRIRSTTGRVKSKRRTWRKVQQPRYQDQITSVDDITDAIDDLVGLRVTCVNVRDIEMVQTALDALPRVAGGGLWLDPKSERDYLTAPKDSGYRAWHVNLGIEVGETPVVCELQVRTLLQDSWGELTHEETYSKDGALPPLVDVLSTRMADLLAIIDDIAEDLRTELDRIDQEAVAESGEGHEVVANALAGQAADAGAFLRGRWVSITRPTDLAGLAWALQREFGAEVSDDWFGHRSFKRFLRHAVPEGEISTGRQAYLLPMNGADTTEAAAPQVPDRSEPVEPDLEAVPSPARELRRIDPAFPLLTAADWRVLFEHLTESWRRVKPQDGATGTVNRLTRSARDLARGAGTSLSRRTLDYVVKALLTADETRTGNARLPTLPDLFAKQTLERMVELRILDNANSTSAASVLRWIVGPPVGSSRR